MEPLQPIETLDEEQELSFRSGSGTSASESWDRVVQRHALSGGASSSWSGDPEPFVVVTDVHLFTDRWEHYLDTDPEPEMLMFDNQKARDTYREIASLGCSLGICLGDLITPRSDWSIYVGDPDHVYANCNWKTVAMIERLAKVPWVHVIGNHEVSCNGENSCYYDPAIHEFVVNNRAEFETLCETFYGAIEDDFMTDKFERNVAGSEKLGYFRFYHHPTRLWHVVLNCLEFSSVNTNAHWGWFSGADKRAPSSPPPAYAGLYQSQRDWFASVMADYDPASNPLGIPAGDKCVVHTHVPVHHPSATYFSKCWDATQAAEFDAIAGAHSDKILAVLSGHLHVGSTDRTINGVRHVNLLCSSENVHDTSYRNQFKRGFFAAARRSPDGDSLEIELFHSGWY